MIQIDRVEIARLTEEYGGAWGIQHTRRLLNLITEIGQGLTYNAEAVWLAAHLHDWGAYDAWAQQDFDHCLRSRQVAEVFLSEHGAPEDLKTLVLECIELHHTAGSGRCLESILLRDADALDFLGVVGVLRNFSMNPKDLRRGCEETKRRRDKMAGLLYLDKAKKLADELVRQMDDLLAQFEAQTVGCY